MFDFDNEKTQKSLYNAFGVGFSTFREYKAFIAPMLAKEYNGQRMEHPAVLYTRSAQENATRYQRIQAPVYKKMRFSFGSKKKKSSKSDAEEEEKQKFTIE
jgi:hypothetical protein